MKKVSKTLTKKHIIFLSCLFHPHIGGVETHALQLSKELIQRGYTVTVITQAYEDTQKYRERYEGIDIVRIPKKYGESKWKIWSWVLQNRSLFTQADIIHAHDVYWWYFPLRICFPNKRSFITFHGWEGVFPPTIRAKIWRKVSEVLAHKNICIGSYIKTWYGTHPDAVLFGATQKSTTPLHSDQNTIVFLGRICPENDIPLYIESFNLLKKRIPQLHITFVGDGSLRKEAQKIGIVTGFVQDPQRYMQDARWVFSSSYLSMIQAMEMKKIVCAVYTNALKKEYIESLPPQSSIISASNSTEFADKFERIYNNTREQEEMVRALHAWAKKQTWFHVADTYEEIWNT